MVRSLSLKLAFLALALGLALPAGASSDCASCNGVSNTAACCRKLAGCEAYASEQKGVNFCRATHEKASAGSKVTAAQCKKNYTSCVHTVQGGAKSVKETQVDGKKIARKTAADALSASRQQCQQRLDTCLKQAN